VGRIERSLFMLEWMKDPELRRRVQVGLHKGEARNALARAVFFNSSTAKVTCAIEALRTSVTVQADSTQSLPPSSSGTPSTSSVLIGALGDHGIDIERVPGSPFTNRMGAHHPDWRLHLAGCNAVGVLTGSSFHDKLVLMVIATWTAATD
jgi:hypothetical protein